LRATRQDLLAWDVPEHGSVWKPFMPAKIAPRWRDIPAWAMAAAASLMFVVGAAGGVLTHALMEKNIVPAERVTATAPSVQAAPVRTATLTASEQQMLRDMRTELASMQQRISARSTTPASWTSLEQMADRINENDTRQYQNGLILSNKLAALARSTDQRLEAITRNLEAINALLAQQQQAGK
jgi:hypothetical protein